MTRSVFCLAFCGLLLSTAAWAGPELTIDRATVTVERRGDRDWCVLDSQVSGVVPVTLERLVAVITDYPSYPRLVPKVREARVEVIEGVTFLSETVVVNALGIENINRFTLRMAQATTEGPPKTVSLSWSQARTDGTIDSLEGGWILEARGTPGAPLTKVLYRTRSAVPVVVFGQDTVIRWFLGGETRAVVEAMVKQAVTR